MNNNGCLFATFAALDRLVHWREYHSTERDDYLRRPGRRAELHVGPFNFYASNADEGWVAFEIMLGRVRFGWEAQGRPGASS